MHHSVSSILLSALLISSLTSVIRSNPSGAPGCAANVPAITENMGAPSGKLGYQIEVAPNYVPGTPVNIKITNPDPAIRSIKGILLYVMPEVDTNLRVGTWTIPSGLKSNTDKCADRAELNSVLTHTNPSDKPLINVDMVWTPGTNLSGNMIVRCMVVGTGPSNWQILDQKVITTGTGGAAPPAPGTPQRKCRIRKPTDPQAPGQSPAPGTPPATEGGETPTEPIGSNGEQTESAPPGADPANGSPDPNASPDGNLPPLGADAGGRVDPASGQDPTQLPADQNPVIKASSALTYTYSPLLLMALVILSVSV